MTRFLIAVTGVVSFLLLALDLWPGAISFAMFCPFLCCITLPALYCVGAAWIGLVGWAAGRQITKEGRVSPFVVACVVWMLFCCGLVCFDVPRVVAFRCYQDEFEALAAAAPVTESGVPLHRWVGPFYIWEYGADGQGAVYFLTVAHADGIGPDTMSYGFALLPNGRGECPFGYSKYGQSSVLGDWYSFSISDD